MMVIAANFGFIVLTPLVSILHTRFIGTKGTGLGDVCHWMARIGRRTGPLIATSGPYVASDVTEPGYSPSRRSLNLMRSTMILRPLVASAPSLARLEMILLAVSRDVPARVAMS